MEIIDIANEIQYKIKEIDSIRKAIRERGEAKAKTMSNYEKAITITIIKLKNGIEFDFEGEKISNPPTTIIDKLSKGICCQEKLAMEVAIANYKSCISNLECVIAQLMALQSLNKYLDKG